MTLVSAEDEQTIWTLAMHKREMDSRVGLKRGVVRSVGWGCRKRASCGT
jgi:hypothetical protein